eukprot:TRINITY_DN2615_c0_g1_i16.p1 TRINITY_DN2615_c0_g1~~TRINITY_DN2615_c0_g1_i16.p1  ORF type:complete len:495 (-),score=74.11 TRINITY_DN2615_c0_g1_i16:264-1748(-)
MGTTRRRRGATCRRLPRCFPRRKRAPSNRRCSTIRRASRRRRRRPRRSTCRSASFGSTARTIRTCRVTSCRATRPQTCTGWCSCRAAAAWKSTSGTATKASPSSTTATRSPPRCSSATSLTWSPSTRLLRRPPPSSCPSKTTAASPSRCGWRTTCRPASRTSCGCPRRPTPTGCRRSAPSSGGAHQGQEGHAAALAAAVGGDAASSVAPTAEPAAVEVSGDDDSDASVGAAGAATPAAGDTKKKVKAVAVELAALVTLGGGSRAAVQAAVEGGASHPPGQPVTDVCSFNETKVEAMATKARALFTAYNARNVTRVYPAASRVNSSNYDPTVAWHTGAHIVALNWQEHDLGMQLNHGRFLANNACGYVRQPPLAAGPTGGPEPPPVECGFLTLHVLAGARIPAAGGAAGGAPTDMVDPYVKVKLFDAAAAGKFEPTAKARTAVWWRTMALRPHGRTSPRPRASPSPTGGSRCCTLRFGTRIRRARMTSSATLPCP